jgi:hypothetical protein
MRVPATARREGRRPAFNKEPLIATTNTIKSRPSPVGGWNSRDALATMKPTEANRLVNWFPRTTLCEIRGGAVDWATGLAATPKALMTWNGPTGTNKLFAATASGIYNVSASGAVGSAETATCTNGKLQWVNFAVASGSEYLIAVNGTDKALYYDGTTWVSVDGVSTPAITGPATTEFIHVNIFKTRLFFIPKNKLSFYYLPVASLGGAATEFFLNTLCPRGGYLMAMGTWSIDAGNGIDDLAVFITSEGEAVVFKGSNPASAADWALVGVYFIGKPIGRRCFTKLGGDLVILIESGAYPLSQALLAAAIDSKSAITNKIETAFDSVARLYSSVFGWEMTVFTQQGALIVNIPTSEGGTHYQYVMNTKTKAWCSFVGWNAECFGVHNSELYFGVGTKVVKAWSGSSDFGSNIETDVKQAFDYFGSNDQKLLKEVRPIFTTTGPIGFLLGADADFGDSLPTGIASYTVGSQALWDVALWDVGLWSVDFLLQKDWKTVSVSPGFCFALLLRVATNAVQIQWVSTDYVFERGVGNVT